MWKVKRNKCWIWVQPGGLFHWLASKWTLTSSSIWSISNFAQERWRGSTTPGHRDWMILPCVSYFIIFHKSYPVWSNQSNWWSITFPPLLQTWILADGWLNGSWLKWGWRALCLRAVALNPFPAWQRFPAHCPPSQKPHHQPEMDRKRAKTTIVDGPGLIWPLRLWDSRAFSVTPFEAFCVCLPVHISMCQDGYLIAPIPAVWLWNRILQVYYPWWVSVCVCVCVWKEEVAACVRAIPDQPYHCAAHSGSFFFLLDAGINKQELICDIHTWQLNKRIHKTYAGPDDSRPPTFPKCWLNQIFSQQLLGCRLTQVESALTGKAK